MTDRRRPDVPGVPGMPLDAPRYVDRTATRAQSTLSPEQIREIAELISTTAERDAARPTVTRAEPEVASSSPLRSLLPPAARGWSPVGIAMAVVTLVTGLGGLAGIGQVVVNTAKELKGAGLATQAEVAEVSRRIDAIDQRLDAWQSAADARDARIGTEERRSMLAAEFACAVNGNVPPFAGSPCPEPGEWTRDNTTIRALTGHRSRRAW